MAPGSRLGWLVPKLIKEMLIGGNGCHMEWKQSIGFSSWGVTTRLQGMRGMDEK